MGLPGSGKTTVGEALARRLGWPLVDTDRMVSRTYGEPVPRQLDRLGESGFRRREQKAVARAAALRQVVVATGGGALAAPANRKRLHQAGPWVWLAVDPATAARRLAGQEERPLLRGDPVRALATLLAARVGFYGESDLVLDTAAADVAAVAEQISQWLGNREDGEPPPPPSELGVAAGAARYPVRVVWGGLEQIATHLAPVVADRRVVVISTPLVAELAAARLAQQLVRAGWTAPLVSVPEGELAKRATVLESTCRTLARIGVDRDTTVVAVGGGALTDLAGFVAATYMRGVPWVACPTTLIGQVDAAIGGKVAVDLPEGKNLMGAFYHPRLVLADPALLLHLPPAAYRQGLGEVVKTGVLAGGELWELLVGHTAALRARRPDVLARAVFLTAATKAHLVAADPDDRGARQVLNLGHTLGHALEAWGGYSRWNHGDAVSVGLTWACRIAANRGWLGDADLRAITDLQAALGLRTGASRVEPADLVPYLATDKKARAGRWRFLLPRAIGQVVPADDVDAEEVALAVKGPTRR